VTEIACTLNLENLSRQLADKRPDLVFNLVEGLGGTDRLLPTVPALLEHLSIPYTGCSFTAISLTNDKTLCKHRLRLLGMPTPDWMYLSGEMAVEHPGRGWPASKRFIIKTIGEHASWGLDDDAVVRVSNADELYEQLEQRAKVWKKPCFAEEYVAGREFNLSLLGGLTGVQEPELLPPAEIKFVGFPQGKPRIVGYLAKWSDDSFEAVHTPRTFEFSDEDESLLEDLTEFALRCWHQCRLDGYARVDFRVNSKGKPWILEVNANPCLSPDAGFAAALARAGIPFDTAIERIITAAMKRFAPFAEETPSAAPIPASPPSSQKPTLRTEVNPGDRRRVREIVESTGFFAPAEVDVAVELVDERLNKGDASGYFFVFAERDGVAAGYACYGPIACTIHSFDLYWIAVDKRYQGLGIGRELLTAAEKRIKAAGGSRIYVETSSQPAYHSTRTFYEHIGYAPDATVIDFYAPKDDKCIYVKVLDR
ncbi:MAG: GNAT family N-acetyltransferase, partial [Planctomycetaceae bacterium]